MSKKGLLWGIKKPWMIAGLVVSSVPRTDLAKACPPIARLVTPADPLCAYPRRYALHPAHPCRRASRWKCGSRVSAATRRRPSRAPHLASRVGHDRPLREPAASRILHPKLADWLSATPDTDARHSKQVPVLPTTNQGETGRAAWP